MRQTQRIEIGGQVAAHPIGADQHHRAHRIRRRLLDRGFVEGGRGPNAIVRAFRHGGLDRRLHRQRIERRCQVILRQRIGRGPAFALPRRPRLRRILRLKSQTGVGREILHFLTHGHHLPSAPCAPGPAGPNISLWPGQRGMRRVARDRMPPNCPHLSVGDRDGPPSQRRGQFDVNHRCAQLREPSSAAAALFHMVRRAPSAPRPAFHPTGWARG